jgi:hypothetical protein
MSLGRLQPQSTGYIASAIGHKPPSAKSGGGSVGFAAIASATGKKNARPKGTASVGSVALATGSKRAGGAASLNYHL